MDKLFYYNIWKFNLRETYTSIGNILMPSYLQIMLP